MAKHSKALLLCSGLMLILIGVPRLLLNAWLPYSNFVFYVSIVLFVVGLSLNYKVVKAFFSMRTTKYGLNMGTLIFLGALLFVSVNFLSFRYDKSFDVTSDKLNSLSLQSLEVLDGLKKETSLKVYFQGAVHKSQNMGLRMLFKKYMRESAKLRISFVDAHKDPSASAYLTRADKGKLVVFVEQGEKRERVSEPISEESITSALFRLEQVQSQKIYFSLGHGERPLESSGSSDAISFLKNALSDKGFDLKTLSLSDGALPKDMSLLVILGPKKELLESEVSRLQTYILEGGRLLLAFDPTYPNVTYSNLISKVGIVLENKTSLSTQTLAGGDSLSVLGRNFDATHPITQVLDKNAITLFYESGGVKKISSDFKVTDLVSTLPVVIPVKDLQSYQLEVQGQKPKSVSVAMISEGSFSDLEHAGHSHDEDNLDFKVGVFADSDFLTDVYFETGFNKDLALNSFAYLAGQDNLVSIRPRVAKNTKLILTTSNAAFVLITPVLIPLILLIFSVVLWFRRRGA